MTLSGIWMIYNHSIKPFTFATSYKTVLARAVIARFSFLYYTPVSLSISVRHYTALVCMSKSVGNSAGEKYILSVDYTTRKDVQIALAPSQ